MPTQRHPTNRAAGEDAVPGNDTFSGTLFLASFTFRSHVVFCSHIVLTVVFTIMSRSSNFYLGFQKEGDDLCPNWNDAQALTLPSTAAQWQSVFNLFAHAPTPQVIRGALTTLRMAVNGWTTSFTLSGKVFVSPQSYIRYNYWLSNGQPLLQYNARGRLKDFLSFGSIETNFTTNQEWNDPEWMFVRYFAQREMRSRLRLCELCGEELTGWER